MSRRRKNLKVAAAPQSYMMAAGLLFGLALIAYWNSFQVPLVFDDLLTIQRNTGVRFGEFNWNLLSARAVLYLTFTLNYIWSGQEVWSYHLINFALHFLNGILVFLVGLSIFRRLESSEHRCRLYALLASAFFLVHPVQTEAVTYISSRSELLSTAFYLLGFLLFVKWPSQRIGFLLSCLIAVPFVFGLGSKETVISLPATIFLYDLLFLSGGQLRPMLRRWSFYLPFIVGGVGAIYYIITVALRGTVGSAVVGNLSPWPYFLTQLRVIVRYISIVFLPLGLNLDYYFPPSTTLWDPWVILSAIVHIAVLVYAWRIRKTHTAFSFSIFWFYLTLAPTSSVIPIADVIFEHRLYLPMIGVCMSFPLVVELLHQKLDSLTTVSISAGTFAVAVLAALTVGTIMRNQVWGDEVRLFQDVVSKSPLKERAYNSLAWAHYKRAEYEPAIAALQRGREKLPDQGLDFSETLGNLYLKAGQFDDAITLFTDTLELKEKSRRALAYNNLGVAHLYKWNALQMQKAQMSPAIYAEQAEEILKPASEAYAKCLEIEPDTLSCLDSLVNVSFYRGVASNVEAKALEKLKEHEDFNSLYTVGKLGFLKNDFAVADQFFERAEKVKNDVKLLYFNHAYALEQLGQNDRAIEKYTQAIRIDPIFIEAHHNVGRLYMDKKDYAEAIEHFAEYLRQDPRHINSNLNLARIYIIQGNPSLARKYLATVLETSPGDQQALAMLQQIGS